MVVAYRTRNGTYLIKVKGINNVTVGGIAADECCWCRRGSGRRWQWRRGPCTADTALIRACRCPDLSVEKERTRE